jgi:hypothetical protein
MKVYAQVQQCPSRRHKGRHEDRSQWGLPALTGLECLPEHSTYLYTIRDQATHIFRHPCRRPQCKVSHRIRRPPANILIGDKIVCRTRDIQTPRADLHSRSSRVGTLQLQPRIGIHPLQILHHNMHIPPRQVAQDTQHSHPVTPLLHPTAGITLHQVKMPRPRQGPALGRWSWMAPVSLLVDVLSVGTPTGPGTRVKTSPIPTARDRDRMRAVKASALLVGLGLEVGIVIVEWSIDSPRFWSTGIGPQC